MTAQPATETVLPGEQNGWDFELVDLTRPITRETVEALFGDLLAGDQEKAYFTKIETKAAWGYDTAPTTAAHLTIPDHVSTHVDAPLHMIEGGTPLEGMDISRLIGEAVVVDLFKGDVDYGYAAADFEAAEPRIEPGDIVLIYSGFKDAVVTERMRQTYLTEEGALWLVERGVKAVGCEPSGIEHTPNGKDAGWYFKDAVNPWPAHRALLRNDVYIIEGLTNLDRIKGRRVKFCALPVILPGLSGFPVRAVAWLDR